MKGSPGARAQPLEKKWLEGSTGLKNDPQGRQVSPLAGTSLGKFLATLLIRNFYKEIHVLFLRKSGIDENLSFEAILR
jgi:hypothetical protein